MGSRFPTTQWSVVLDARDGSEAEARRALESLCTAYWYPLYAYVRSRGQGPEAAADLTQAYFADLLQREVLRVIDPAKGRFRSFLLASLKNFLSHERDKQVALKRGGATSTVSFDVRGAEGRFELEPVEDLTPEEVFERRWGLTVMERALERLRLEAVQREGASKFELLLPYLTGIRPSPRYGEVAVELGTSESAVKNSVSRLRQSYGRILRELIADTVADTADVDDELRNLLAVIRPWQSKEG